MNARLWKGENVMGWRNLLCGHIILILGVCALGAADPNEKGNSVPPKNMSLAQRECPACGEGRGPKVARANQQEIERLNRQVARALQIAEGSGLGDTKLLITGSAAAGYFDPEDESSTFTAEFNPMLLWQLNERLFFEGELELGLEGPELNGEGSETEAELDLAYLSYLINDYAAVSAGKFSVPFTAYHNHLDPSWINKLPIDPLVYADGGIAPDTGVGAFVTGAVPCRRGLFNYAVFLTNGPALITDDPESAGSLNFDNFNDLNNNKALGLRIGYLPIPQLEVGYSFEFSRPNPPGFETVRSTIHGVDLNYLAHIGAVQGQVTARGAWIWSNLSEATYDPTGAVGIRAVAFRQRSQRRIRRARLSSDRRRGTVAAEPRVCPALRQARNPFGGARRRHAEAMDPRHRLLADGADRPQSGVHIR